MRRNTLELYLGSLWASGNGQEFTILLSAIVVMIYKILGHE